VVLHQFFLIAWDMWLHRNHILYIIYYLRRKKVRRTKKEGKKRKILTTNLVQITVVVTVTTDQKHVLHHHDVYSLFYLESISNNTNNQLACTFDSSALETNYEDLLPFTVFHFLGCLRC
jgi:hypothetical protein